MSFLELVKKRKSVRRYSAKSVPREVIDRCIEAARLAPSACNSQPWYFIVVDDENLKRDLAGKAFSGIYSTNSFAKEAPVLIVALTERSNYIARLGGYLKGVQYSLIDIGIACEHLILQAEEEGLGTCWLGWFNENAVKKVLGLPKEKKIDVIISMGYPEEEEARDKARKSLDEIRRFNYVFKKIRRSLDSQDSSRKYLKAFIKDIKKRCPSVKTNIFRRIVRIKSDYIDLKED